MTPVTRRWIEALAPHCLGHVETLLSTYAIARHVLELGVPGDFVECGVYAGAQCAVMARALEDFSREHSTLGRRVHLFDSFQGMPQCGPEDSEFIQAGNKPGEAACDLAGVQSNMHNWGIPEDLLVYHKGWFQDTLPYIVHRSRTLTEIALLRLDGDLYGSTKVCLEHLYPLVPRGGWVIVDDYPLSGCRKALHEVVGYPQPMQWCKTI